MATCAALVELLNESSAPYRDPLTRLRWDSLDLESWWLPPAALSLDGVAEFDALPAALRRRLSHYEYAWLLEAGLWLEALFIERLGGALDSAADPALRMRYLHEIREEAGHSLMFLELMQRSGVVLHGAAHHRPWLARRWTHLLRPGSPIFWAFAVIGEELPDKLNRMVRQGVAEATVSALVFHMSTLHIIDEARHIAHARAMCAESAAGLSGWRRRVASPLVERALRDYARFLFYPPALVYAAAGLPARHDWPVLARRNAQRRRIVAQAVLPTQQFLVSAGWHVRAPHHDRHHEPH